MKKITHSELQKIEACILDEILLCCKKNNIQVFVGYGTLLGAIRHKGFIPWDDDIDLLMPRKDVERFVLAFQNSSNLKLYVEPIFKNTMRPIRRVGVQNIDTCITINGKEEGCVNVHIFPIDVIGKGILTNAKFFVIEALRKGRGIDVSVRRSCIKHVALFLYKLIADSFSDETLASFYSKLLVDDMQQNEGRYSKICVDPYFFYKRYPTKIFASIEHVPFEHLIVPVPIGYDQLLTLIYGDYMVPPPDSERITNSQYEYFWK